MQALVGYFGETRAEPCGHCSYCLDGQRGRAPGARAAAGDRRRCVDADALARADRGEPRRAGQPRQRARFLCGIASPATSRAKLTRDPLFGALAEHRFADVLAWCAAHGPA